MTKQAVNYVEIEWEQQLGPSQFAQLRELLGQLSAKADSWTA